MATVSVHYINAVLACMQRRGKPVTPLLQAVQLDQARLTHAQQRVPAEVMTQLVKQVWAGLADEFMGCTRRPCKQGVFALMTRHVLRCDSLQAVLEQGIHFYNLFTDDIQMRLQQRGGRVELRARFREPAFDPDHFYQEFWLVIWHRFASWLIGCKIPLIQVSFPYSKPAHHTELKHLFPCRHRFNHSELTFSFSEDYLACQPVRTQRDLARFLKHSPADLITIPGDEKRFAAMIRARLLHQPAEVLHCPSFESLAQGFNISSQTLRRRLRDEGTSYPQIKAEIRRDLAIEKLYSQRLAVSDIARMLGFSEARSFTRAFKQWTGQTPSAYLSSRAGTK